MGRAEEFSSKYPKPKRKPGNKAKADAEPLPMVVATGGTDRFEFRPKNDSQAKVKELFNSRRLFILIGDRGTGKSACALGMGLHELAADRARRVVVTRPTVAVQERLGFFPGNLEEKLGPWFAAAHDVLEEFGIGAEHKLMRKIEPVALGMLEGRTFTNCVYVADELQHATDEQLDVAVSRIGRGCRAFFCGSPTVRNSPFLRFATELASDPDVEVIRIPKTDQVRDQFINRIMALRNSEV